MDESDFLFGEEDGAGASMREVKLRLPVSHLIRLHSIKLLDDRFLSEIVRAALDAFFVDLDRDGLPQTEARWRRVVGAGGDK